MWTYDSGGHHRDQRKYSENYERIFGNQSKTSGTSERELLATSEMDDQILLSPHTCSDCWTTAWPDAIPLCRCTRPNDTAVGTCIPETP